jgi:GT2 family glycosyltransferase
MDINVSIIIVSYNCSELLRKCMLSVYKQTTGLNFEIIVIDNSSIDNTLEMLSTHFPSVIVIANKQNYGFACANNHGIKITKGKYILLLNPDTVLSENAILKTITFMESKTHAGIVGCRLNNEDGSWQASVNAFPSVLGTLFDSFFLNYLFFKTYLFTKKGWTKIDIVNPSKVDWVMGAFFLIKREVIQNLGGMDEQYFMYSEEMDYCYRASKKGFETWYYPLTSITHNWGGISNVSKRTVTWVLISRKLFLSKHYNKVKSMLIQIITYAGLAIRVVCYSMVGIIFLKRTYFNKAIIFFTALMKMLLGASCYEAI